MVGTSVQVEFQTSSVDVSVLSYCGGVVGQFAGRIYAAIAKLVFAACVYPLRTELSIQSLAEFKLYECRRIDEVR